MPRVTQALIIANALAYLVENTTGRLVHELRALARRATVRAVANRDVRVPARQPLAPRVQHVRPRHVRADLERVWGPQRYLLDHTVSVGPQPCSSALRHGRGARSRQSGHPAACSACCSRSRSHLPHRKVIPLIPPIPMPAWLSPRSTELWSARARRHRHGEQRRALRAPRGHARRLSAHLALANERGDALSPLPRHWRKRRSTRHLFGQLTRSSTHRGSRPAPST